MTKHSDKPGLPDDARAGHPSRSHPGDPAVDPNPDDVLDAEVVELVLRELGDSAAEPDAYLHSRLVVSPSDGHPSPLQHWMIAEKLLATLEQQGIIAGLLAK